MVTPADLTTISDAFRTKFQQLEPEYRLEYEQILQSAFGLKNIRNVQLWTRNGTQQRNFLNTSVAPLELEARLTFAMAFLNETPPTSPQKETEITGSAKRKGQRLREYLFNDYTRDAATIITLEGGEILYAYTADSSGGDLADDELSDEFDDFL